MEEYVKIATIDNEVEAALLDSILGSRAISHAIRVHHTDALPIPEPVDGWGVIEGPVQSRDEIVEILQDLRTRAPEPVEENQE